MTSESAHQNLSLEASLQKHYFRSFTLEALLQKLYFRSTLQKHYFRSTTSEASEVHFRSTLQLLITVLMVVQKGVHKQTQNHQEHEEHASTHDMNKRSSKVYLHDSINNKGMDKELCQEGL